MSDLAKPDDFYGPLSKSSEVFHLLQAQRAPEAAMRSHPSTLIFYAAFLRIWQYVLKAGTYE